MINIETPCRNAAETNQHYQQLEMQDVITDKDHLVEWRTSQLVEESICEFDDSLVDCLLDCDHMKELIKLKPIEGKFEVDDIVMRARLLNRFLVELDNRLKVHQKPFAEEEYDNGDLGE